MLAWYRLTRIQDNVRERHPGITTTLAGNDKLLVDDKMVIWDVNKKKIVTKPVHTLPRRDKNRYLADIRDNFEVKLNFSPFRSKLRIEEFLDGV